MKRDDLTALFKRYPSLKAPYEFIEAHPGARLKQMQIHFDVGWSSAFRWVDRLEAEGLVKRIKEGNTVFLFPTHEKVDRKKLRAQLATTSDKAQQILAHVNRNPGIDFLGLCRRLRGFSGHSIYYHVRKLIKNGIITSGQKHRYADLRAVIPESHRKGGRAP